MLIHVRPHSYWRSRRMLKCFQWECSLLKALNGKALNGKTLKEYALYGNALYGNALYGNAIDGNALYENAVYGNALYGHALFGNAVFRITFSICFSAYLNLDFTIDSFIRIAWHYRPFAIAALSSQ